ncbi:MAG: hypothetical protein FJ143_05345 [Deltaproteobacteria bacterium]|nr:hypothetical protein [Deltaproteobacteria bacterium]
MQERRRPLHGRIFEALERIYADRLSEHCELLAHHAWRGELWERAVGFLHQAGRKSATRSAYNEAARYFEQALEALAHLPQTPETVEQAINIRVDLGPVLIALRGYYAPEVERTYTQARELCRLLGEPPQLFPVLWGLARIYDHHNLQKGRELGKQLLDLAERIGDTALLLEAHHESWANLFSLGELPFALGHANRGSALYDPEKHRQYASLYAGHDPGVCALRHAAMTLWLLGYPDRALEKSRDALALAHKLSHPYSLIHALFYSAWIHQQRGERQAVREYADTGTELAIEQGLKRRALQGVALQGWIMTQEDNWQEGIDRLRQGVGADFGQLLYIAQLAEAYGKVGQIEDGLKLVYAELMRVKQTGECLYQAELHRVNGELVLAQAAPQQSEAEACFLNALQVARGQSAKSL